MNETASVYLDLLLPLSTQSSPSLTSNNTTEAAATGDFNLPWWQQLFFYVIFVAMFLVAAGGNIIVIWIVLAHKRMRTVTNYFLVNLAVSDVMISLLNTPFNFVFLLYQDWWFGRVYCKFCFFISPCAISASVLTFMAIAIDR
ncbi:hypothetical protein ACOMHN_005930 [Nucella lapillus]